MKKTEKTFFIENLKEELKSSSSVVLVDYTGLSVKAQQELKKRLKAANAKMFVAKNTLFKLAAKDAKMPEEVLQDSVLSGPTAFILTEEDPIAPIQVLAKFASEFEIPQFKVGIVEKSFQDKESLIKLSMLPGKEALFAQVVGSIGSPLYGLVGTLQGNLQKLVFILDQASKK
jgi:large subunit ribosomal protein L10